MMRTSAKISICERYRWVLGRDWDFEKPRLFIVMLNPSTADGHEDDPTIRKCIGFAQRNGYGAIAVCNLYAFRATDPADLWKAEDPIGNACDGYMMDIAEHMDVLVAWGANARDPLRVDTVLGNLALAGVKRFLCLGKTKEGHPRHPLMVAYEQPLEPFE